MKVLLGSLLLAAVAPAWGTDLPAFPFIEVTGHATRQAPPDLARVSFAVRSRDASAEVAAKTVADRTQEALDLLSDGGIAPADIDAHRIDKEVIAENESGGFSAAAKRPAVLRYEVSRSFAVLIRTVAVWPDLGTKLLQMPNVENIESQFDRSDRKALEEGLIADAAHDAQRQAEALATGFGQHLGAVVAVSQSSFEHLSGRFLEGDAQMASANAARAFYRKVSSAQVSVPDQITFQESVNAIYRLEPAAH